MVLRAWGKREIHQMGNGRLSLTRVGRPHNGLQKFVNPCSTASRKQDHLQIHYTPHHPVIEDASAVCVDPSETGCSSAS